MSSPVWLTTTRKRTGINVLKSIWAAIYRMRYVLIVIFVASLVEVVHHNRKYSVARPSVSLDEPFQYGCQEPNVTAARENAAVVVLGRNSDLHSMIETLDNFDRQFNHWAKYPVVFLNDEIWDPRVVEAVKRHVSGEAIFDIIKPPLWGFPDHIDMERAHADMFWQGNHGVMYGNMAGYHHMCRFYSGQFYDHPALLPYKWYWRVDTDVRLTSAITYDPFVAMAKANKTYGYTIAFGEMRNSVSTLFQETTRYKKEHNIPSTDLWNLMVSTEWFPWPVRKLLGLIPPLLYNEDSASWNTCQFWSNFEIGDMDFFRSKQYRDYFEYLDRTGKFYYERWGDASVHSLGLALFLEPKQIHHFADFGYDHDGFENCPHDDESTHHTSAAPAAVLSRRSSDYSNAVGCKVECGPKIGKNPTQYVCHPVFRWALDPA